MDVSFAPNLVKAIPDKYLLYPAQFWSHKNHKAIIEAIDLLRTRGLVINAVFVGSDQGNKTEIVSLIREKKLIENIRILGYVSNEELIHLYRNAVALVMPTFFGPTSIPPLEAMALGCPVITSRIFSIPEQLGNAALYVDPNNCEELAQKIELIWKNEKLRKTLIARGYKKDQLWNQEAFKNRLQEIIETLCEP
jgi:glycosyltransferase involved in cell wall biosynthesis